MSSTTVSTFVAAGLLAALCGCTSESGDPPPNYVPPAGGSTSAGGGGAGGGGAGGGAGGVAPQGGTGGVAPQGGTGGGGGNAGGAAGTAGTGGDGGGAGAGDITAVRPTMGCTMAPPVDLEQGNFTERHMEVSGTKDPDSTDTNIDGPWTMDRQYFVRLPNGYDNTKAYPMILQGPGCGGDGRAVYPLGDIADQVIKVGFTPPDPGIVGHVEAPGGGCFDDKEGDDSVDWPFYEAVWDLLASELCFDQNRVFASGNSSGAWWGNELACKYAGDPNYPMRGIGVNTGGLPTDPTRVPTCNNNPFSGMWIHETNDGTNPFTGNKVAIARAMSVNGCTIGTNYDDTSFENYPIGGGNPDDTCRKIQGCPDLFPLVVCELPGNGHGSHDNVANPGFSTFFASHFAQ